MADKRVTVKEFADYFQFEQLTGDEQSLKRGIELTDTNRPGLELAGFFDYSQAKRLVILGDKEIAYIATMSEKAQKRSFDFLTGEETPAIVITRGHECPKILRECALEKNFPVFCCEEKTNHTIVNIITWLDEKLAKSVSVHGELLIIYGTGVMICGESGMGKSEIALELIKRGHQLVADDRVDCYRIHNHLVGKSPQLLEGMLELRGVGVINIARMYGVGAVAHKANVDIQITLEEFDVDEMLPGRILLCGGGAGLTRLQEVLATSDWMGDLPFARRPVIHLVTPEEIPGIINTTETHIDHSFITAVGLLRVALDTLGTDTSDEGLRGKLAKLLQN